MKISVNLTIKLFHSERCSDEQVRANANELSRVLSPLDGPWAIERAGPLEITAYCRTSVDDAIVIPTMPEVSDVRVQPVRTSVELCNAMITWQ